MSARRAPAAPPQRMIRVSFNHWTPVEEPRAPWTPLAVRAELDAWWQEVEGAELLAAAGERVLPLLLVGETRCGKTSSACALAARAGLPVRRMSLASVVGGLMGDTARKMHDALLETCLGERALWVIDELDGVAMPRGGDDAAAKERTHAVATLLAELEQLPPGLPLVATSNIAENIDPAVRARFVVVRWPAWSELPAGERDAFACSHGLDVAAGAELGSYAEAVQRARRARVARIIAGGAA